MLRSMTRGVAALAAAITCVGSLALAGEHVVEIAEGAYLPIVTHVNLGDTLVFKNESDFDHTISGSGESWTSGSIPPGGSFVLSISDDIPQTFGGGGTGGMMLSGEFSFEPAPLEEEDL